jgi:hypothetical protein
MIVLGEPCDTLFDRRRWPKTDLALKISNVGIGCFDIAGLDWQHFFHGGPAELTKNPCSPSIVRKFFSVHSLQSAT